MRTFHVSGRHVCCSVAFLVSLCFQPFLANAFDGPYGPWNDLDIGDTGAFGGAAFADGVFILSGSGADIWGATDAFHYAYHSWGGDCACVLRVTDVDNTDAFSRAGIMFRATLQPDSPHAFVFFRAAGLTGFQTRNTTAQNSWADGTWSGPPYWLKLERNGNTFLGYDSPDGTNWNLIASTNIDMPPFILVGLAVTSDKRGSLCTATCDSLRLASRPATPTNVRSFRAFDSIHISWTDNSTNETGFKIQLRQRWNGTNYYYGNRSVGPNVTNYIETWLPGVYFSVAATGLLASAWSEEVTPLSGILDPVPAPWQGADIGAVGLPSGETFLNDTFQIASAGSDIGGVSDQFHFLYQTLRGDGEIVGVAPGATLEFDNYGGKGGLMFRQSLDPASPNVFFFAGAGGSGFGTQMRPGLGAGTTTNAIPPGEYEYMYRIRITRVMDTFTIYGASINPPLNWIPLNTWQLHMTNPIYVGMAAASHDNDFLQISTFQSVRVARPGGSLAAAHLNNNAVLLSLNGMFNYNYTIEASSNLVNWTVLTTQLNTNGVIVFTDNAATNYTRRFYRSHHVP